MLEMLPLSVVVSIHDSERTLREVLSAIRASELHRDSYEVIVVDDASADGSVAIAARYADTVVKLNGRRSGPAYARNRGVELARGQVIAFVDDDVVVRPDTLPRMLATLVERPDVDAVSASHADSSGATNFVSQYWNLLLRFGEQRHSGRCAQFAPGCGAVRRGAFLSAGMYDEWRFATACLENVELGERLLGAGHEVLLSSELKVTHLKQWDLDSVCQEVWFRSKLLARSLGYYAYEHRGAERGRFHSEPQSYASSCRARDTDACGSIRPVASCRGQGWSGPVSTPHDQLSSAPFLRECPRARFRHRFRTFAYLCADRSRSCFVHWLDSSRCLWRRFAGCHYAGILGGGAGDLAARSAKTLTIAGCDLTSRPCGRSSPGLCEP